MKLKLGPFIKKERLNKGLKVRGLSRTSGVTLSYLSNLENEKIDNPNPSIVADLFSALEIPLSRMADFGLIESPEMGINLQNNYNTEKRNEYIEEIRLLLEGMELSEVESLSLLLKGNFSIIKILSVMKENFHRKQALSNLETFLEFAEFKKEKEKKKALHPTEKKNKGHIDGNIRFLE
ncbi:helix-turn-helix domain-containing protein [Neobacillus niacini]|uniref:helix-turn-helix domain-containing protein n=1 Tax=Neobacillus niacini TaxID=86668 RepID=UPI00204171D1|nr:helix-turn-helix transcriptional regulator [Neobacillus niacini]MCM3692211.1 helix-turn-helix transcriptional regulator [Neobacillus niacini]